MSTNTNGLIYEQQIHDNLKLHLPESYTMDNIETRNFSQHGTDIQFSKNNIEYHIEVKRDIFAQMGGTSISYQNQEFDVVGNVQDDLKHTIIQQMKFKKQAIDTYLDFMQEHNPLFKERKVPFMVPVPVWDKAKELGLLTNLNHFIEYNTDFIKNHYISKNVNYIQIGNTGLYHLGSNPLNLNVPELHGDINIEIRLCRSGQKLRDINDTPTKVAGANYRIQGRLVSINSQNFNLENSQDIVTLFS